MSTPGGKSNAGAKSPSGKAEPDAKERGSSRRWLWIALAIVVVVAIVAGVGGWLATRGSSEPQLDHRQFAALFGGAVLHQTTIDYIKKWPKPYQIYHDSYQHQCYEWYDKPIALYSLCFKNGTLVNKDLL
jgi:hypothetical protein